MSCHKRTIISESESMLSLLSVMSPPPALGNLSLRAVVKLCTLVVLTLGVSLVS